MDGSRRWGTWGKRAGIGAVIAAVASFLPVLAPSADALWPSNVVDIRGHGWGHGRGLGQYGSLGYAVDHGWNAGQILDHYYGGTTAGTQADGEVTVRLSAFDDGDLIVTSNQGFMVGPHAFAAGQGARVYRQGGTWTIARSDADGSPCDGSVGGSGPWPTVQGGIPVTEEPGAAVADPGDDVSKMLIVCAANSRAYRGRIKIVSFGEGTRVVNTVLMEQYLRGVVPRESPASWADLGGGKGLEALKAQAVAARSYAWAEGRDAKFKTCDTTACQVYGGAGLNGVRIEDARTDVAIAQTAGVVRMKGGAVQRTEFSSSTGGHTAGGTFPAVADDGDDTASNPNHNWSVQLPVSEIEAAYPAIGRLEHIVVLERNGVGADGGRVKRITIRGTSSTVTVTGDAFRGAVGLKSDWFVIQSLTKPAVAMAPSPSGNGFLLASNDGGVFAYGDAVFRGSAGALTLNGPIVGMAARPGGAGYWLVGGDGGIFSYGDVAFHGSTGAMRLNKPVVGMASTAVGNGYWLVASDGGIFAFGDAPFHGSTGAIALFRPIVGMVPTPSGHGYWLVASDGGVFAFGDAPFHGSTGAIRLNRPIVGMAATPDGGGYWLVADDGGIFAFGNAPFKGAATGASQPIVDMARTNSGQGYWLLAVDGGVYTFGDATLN